MADYARFWSVDLHTHSPASGDVVAKVYGGDSPDDYVRAALEAGLDAVAITDHNTAAWCDEIAEAARGTALVVLPGVEISTTEGHLLAIWEEGTPANTIEELLTRLGIGAADRGKLDIAAEVGIADAAKEIAASGGIAIAAHVDMPKGLLRLEVAAVVKRTLLTEELCAVEVVDLEKVTTVRAKVATSRHVACVRGSDATVPGSSGHRLAGIGNRRTWIKAARPNLVGIRHALSDPDLRVSLEDPSGVAGHPTIESISLAGGFLDGVTIELCPDLNCLLGGTGAGKSLVLEAMRYALCQQVDATEFPGIWTEVKSRLLEACGSTGVVGVTVSVNGERFCVERPIGDRLETVAVVYKDIDGEWLEVDVEPNQLLQLSAFSQGEILEYSRQPVGRMTLVDASIDVDAYDQLESELASAIRENGSNLLAQRAKVTQLQNEVATEDALAERAKQLSDLFDNATVKQQELWKAESSRLSELSKSIPTVQDLDVVDYEGFLENSVAENADLFERASSAMQALQADIASYRAELTKALEAAELELDETQKVWNERFATFKAQLDSELEKVADGKSLVALRAQLEHLQGELADLRSKKARLNKGELPRLTRLMGERDELLGKLHSVRMDRRNARRSRVRELNSKMAGLVRLDVPSRPDVSAFRAQLSVLKVGSRVRDEVLDAIAESVHPIQFVIDILDGNVNGVAEAHESIDVASVARLLANVEDRNLYAELVETQCVTMPDVLNVKFKKPDDGSYVAIESLAHGQRCTAILIILLADGDSPVIVDQPEDALHAPWIEEYLVERLRALRGHRQYIFATRSPGLVVGADAEQIVTMKATAGRGGVEASGSLEQYDLNHLALHHLEGGAEPFRRRSAKLEPSVRGSGSSR